MVAINNEYSWLKLNEGLLDAIYETTKTLWRSSDVSLSEIGETLAKACNRSGLRNAVSTQKAILGISQAHLSRLKSGSSFVRFEDDSRTILVRTRRGEGVVEGTYDLATERFCWNG